MNQQTIQAANKRITDLISDFEDAELLSFSLYKTHEFNLACDQITDLISELPNAQRAKVAVIKARNSATWSEALRHLGKAKQETRIH
ncbi:hypothetical protein [Vibrio parahaemolyticus]|uniref:hypothetical protein n=1 Tax=Vibrio parahaemolyticus TaxID=670 RepID=UPI00040A810C|nr:hypothetical protein [Vibrio parahaemolyticus]EJY0698400.1 hypothetical protein [Vibrio parahaemolyticus]MCC3842002.1 hypothetical protein [Vibrio parahaemolyticus]TOK56188.1 hypothetical protein CGI15_16760 [Vibrio parahaemolyticus]HBC3410875.1 hypothetical protein [Vibrio parahaemolyticus]HCG9323463.1 hypothetical protein [Vibrio parahaemolyticus]